MKQSQRTNILTGICLVLAVIAAVVWYSNRPGVKPAPNAGGYYTGPMRSKGDRSIFATDEGKRVETPPEILAKEKADAEAPTKDTATTGKSKTPAGGAGGTE